MSEYNALSEIEINAEKCKSCKNIVPLDQLDKSYDGIVATYADETCCTLECMGNLTELAQ